MVGFLNSGLSADLFVQLVNPEQGLQAGPITFLNQPFNVVQENI